MATLICDMHDCVHISKRPLRSWTNKATGAKCYSCSREYALISKVFDPDGDIEAVAGRENMARGSFYEPREKAPQEGDEEVEEDE